MRRLAVLALVLAGACSSPAADLAVETFPDQGAAHIPEGTPTPEYNSDPPTSGPHYPVWAPCGIYRQEIPDGYQVHSLEHGAVVVQYRPSLPDDEVRRLEELARRLGGHIIVAPRSGLEVPVAVTAWTRMMRLDEVDPEAIEAFHAEYGGRGPERVACPFEVDEAA